MENLDGPGTLIIEEMLRQVISGQKPDVVPLCHLPEISDFNEYGSCKLSYTCLR
jgi:hypothetical protein